MMDLEDTGTSEGMRDGPTPAVVSLVQHAGTGVQQAHPAWRHRARGTSQGDPDPPAQEPAGGSERRRHDHLQDGGKRQRGWLGPAETMCRYHER